MPDDLKSTLCHAFGPRKYAWILETVAAAAESGDFDRLANELAEASAPRPVPRRPRRIDHARTRLLAMLVDRMRQPDDPGGVHRVYDVAHECGVSEDFEWAVRPACHRLGIDIKGRMSLISEADAARLRDALRK